MRPRETALRSSVVELWSQTYVRLLRCAFFGTFQLRYENSVCFSKKVLTSAVP
jgi:hypothetical protein